MMYSKEIDLFSNHTIYRYLEILVQVLNYKYKKDKKVGYNEEKRMSILW